MSQPVSALELFPIVVEGPAPTVTVEVPQPADKLVTFHRNSDGEIIEAETSPVAA